jgi:hypothetical protein
MNRFSKLAGATAVALALSACAGSFAPPQTMFARFSSYVDPAFRGEHPVPKRVLVAAPRMSIEARRAAEQSMAGAVRVRGIEPVMSIDLFPPTRGNPTDDDIAAGLRERGIDYAVVFTPTDETVETRTGTRNVPVTTTDWVFVGGRWREVEVRTTVPQQYNVRLPQGTYVAELKTPGGVTAWRAEGNVRSTSAQNSFSDLAATAATAVVEQMQRDGILPAPPPPPGAPGTTTTNRPLPPPPA